ncbi:MAG: hypothetical protein ACFFAS_12305 [Promethearchaeota archaeon]
MLSKEDIIEKSRELGFADIGFTTAEPFKEQVEVLNSRKEKYSWKDVGNLLILVINQFFS